MTRRKLIPVSVWDGEFTPKTFNQVSILDRIKTRDSDVLNLPAQALNGTSEQDDSSGGAVAAQPSNPDPIPNYTGPYVSDGQLQPSVAFGSAVPKDDLDKLARIHDSHYANHDDAVSRMVADYAFYEDAMKLEGLAPHIAAWLVLYGNQIGRVAQGLVSHIVNPLGLVGAVIGAIYEGVVNMYHLYQYNQHRDEILASLQNEVRVRDPYYNNADYRLGWDTKSFGGGFRINNVRENQDYVICYGDDSVSYPQSFSYDPGRFSLEMQIRSSMNEMHRRSVRYKPRRRKRPLFW